MTAYRPLWPLSGALALIPAVVLLAASPAQAQGWRYTRWGMTPQEVKTASAGQIAEGAILFDAGAGWQELRVQTVAMDAQFSLTLGFRDGRLSDVILTPFDKTLCPRVRMEIEAARGAAPTTQTRANGVVSRWADDQTAAWIELDEQGVDDFDCRVIYRPRQG